MLRNKVLFKPDHEKKDGWKNGAALLFVPKTTQSESPTSSHTKPVLVTVNKLNNGWLGTLTRCG